MEHNFWHERWRTNDIGFHEADGNWLLKQYFKTLHLAPCSRVFVPFCGKTKDLAWLLSNGMRVVAIELDESAVTQLIEDLGGGAHISTCGKLTLYSLPNLDVYQGDFFSLRANILGSVDAVYDRAALVALPSDLRQTYACHLAHITKCCQQLLVCFQYTQSFFDGPPFNVSEDEINLHYSANYHIACLQIERLQGGFRGQKDVFEAMYKLSPKAH